jgi:hypothetical protein
MKRCLAALRGETELYLKMFSVLPFCDMNTLWRNVFQEDGHVIQNNCFANACFHFSTVKISMLRDAAFC